MYSRADPSAPVCVRAWIACSKAVPAGDLSSAAGPRLFVPVPVFAGKPGPGAPQEPRPGWTGRVSGRSCPAILSGSRSCCRLGAWPLGVRIAATLFSPASTHGVRIARQFLSVQLSRFIVWSSVLRRWCNDSRTRLENPGKKSANCF